jgi:hypothetical protein
MQACRLVLAGSRSSWPKKLEKAASSANSSMQPIDGTVLQKFPDHLQIMETLVEQLA